MRKINEIAHGQQVILRKLPWKNQHPGKTEIMKATSSLNLLNYIIKCRIDPLDIILQKIKQQNGFENLRARMMIF